MTIVVYVNTSKQVDDKETWSEKNEPEAVAFKYEFLE